LSSSIDLLESFESGFLWLGVKTHPPVIQTLMAS
jgi:hypothetical protein